MLFKFLNKSAFVLVLDIYTIPSVFVIAPFCAGLHFTILCKRGHSHHYKNIIESVRKFLTILAGKEKHVMVSHPCDNKTCEELHQDLSCMLAFCTMPFVTPLDLLPVLMKPLLVTQKNNKTSTNRSRNSNL